MKASLTKTEINLIHKKADVVHFHSAFNFLKEHNGFRKGSLHVFIAAASAGKSTLVRSILTDICLTSKTPKCLLLLSEETKIDFLSEFYRSGIDPKLATFDLISEIEDIPKGTSVTSQLRDLKLFCKEEEYEILIIDNLTTSRMYMGRVPKEQDSVAVDLKILATELEIPIIVMAHTGGASELNGRLVESNDIRGSKGIVNLAQFFYILQPFKINEVIYPTLRITKHRGQETPHTLYKLTYSFQARMYAQDEKMSFNNFKKIFNERNKL